MKKGNCRFILTFLSAVAGLNFFLGGGGGAHDERPRCGLLLGSRGKTPMGDFQIWGL